MHPEISKYEESPMIVKDMLFHCQISYCCLIRLLQINFLNLRGTAAVKHFFYD